MEENNSLFGNFYNFPSIRLQKYMFEILQERYPKHEALLERLGQSMPLDRDMKAFSELVLEIYELGYLKAIKDYESELKKLGYNVNIVAPETSEPQKAIFPS